MEVPRTTSAAAGKAPVSTRNTEKKLRRKNTLNQKLPKVNTDMRLLL